jgi:hypothetical protein
MKGEEEWQVVLRKRLGTEERGYFTAGDENDGLFFGSHVVSLSVQVCS